MAYTPHGRTPAEINDQQKRDAERERTKRRMDALANSPARPLSPQELPVQQALAIVQAGSRLPQLPGAGEENYRQRYLDAIAPAAIAGRLIKFGKGGSFFFADDKTEISPVKDFVALCDETLIGWIKFSEEEGTPPERCQGLLYDGFTVPPREDLGDLDQSTWRPGLSGSPEDPWKHQIALVLQDRETLELVTFAAMSITCRGCVGNLLKHYDRLQRTDPDSYPIVRLKSGGFNHRDPRVGWVATPVLAVVGKAPKASAAKPDSSPAADMEDQIPF